jgi:hypothetical protein
VYLNLSPDAALPVEGAQAVPQAVGILKSGIKRNFKNVKDVIVFIDGHEVT